MPQATTADARSGYEIFKRSGFTASRAEISEKLTQMGLSPISDRMYRHYRSLARAGFDRYISINRFDVARASEPYENLSTFGRYKYSPAAVGARVTFPRGRRLVEAYGTAERIGETGLVLVFDSLDTVRALNAEGSRPRLGEFIRVELLEPVRQFDARITEVERSPKRVTLDVEFTRLQSVAEYIGRDALPVALYNVRLVAEEAGDASVDVLGRQIYYLFEAVETARAVVNEAAAISKEDLYAPVTRVHRMTMRSPLHVLVGVPDAVAMVLMGAFALLVLARKLEELRGLRLQNNSQKIDNELKEAQAEYDKEVLKLRTKVAQQLSQVFQLSEEKAEEAIATTPQLGGVLHNLAEHGVVDAQVEPAKDQPRRHSS